jgi:hypothetical protein
VSAFKAGRNGRLAVLSVAAAAEPGAPTQGDAEASPKEMLAAIAALAAEMRTMRTDFTAEVRSLRSDLGQYVARGAGGGGGTAAPAASQPHPCSCATVVPGGEAVAAHGEAAAAALGEAAEPEERGVGISPQHHESECGMAIAPVSCVAATQSAAERAMAVSLDSVSCIEDRPRGESALWFASSTPSELSPPSSAARRKKVKKVGKRPDESMAHAIASARAEANRSGEAGCGANSVASPAAHSSAPAAMQCCADYRCGIAEHGAVNWSPPMPPARGGAQRAGGRGNGGAERTLEGAAAVAWDFGVGDLPSLRREDTAEGALAI